MSAMWLVTGGSRTGPPRSASASSRVSSWQARFSCAMAPRPAGTPAAGGAAPACRCCGCCRPRHPVAAMAGMRREHRLMARARDREFIVSGTSYLLLECRDGVSAPGGGLGGDQGAHQVGEIFEVVAAGAVRTLA